MAGPRSDRPSALPRPAPAAASPARAPAQLLWWAGQAVLGAAGARAAEAPTAWERLASAWRESVKVPEDRIDAPHCLRLRESDSSPWSGVLVPATAQPTTLPICNKNRLIYWACPVPPLKGLQEREHLDFNYLVLTGSSNGMILYAVLFIRIITLLQEYFLRCQ